MAAVPTGIALLGFGALSTASPGASVARALRAGWRGRVELLAIGEDASMGGAWTPGLVDQLHLLQADSDSDACFFDALAAIHATRRLDALIPCDERQVLRVAAVQERLASRGIRTLLPRTDRLAVVARPELDSFLRERELKSPKSLFVPRPSQVAACAEQLGFPLWVKGAVAGAVKVFSAGQAVRAAEQVRCAAHDGVVLQCMPPGEIFDVAVVVKRAGDVAALVAQRRLAGDEYAQVVCATVVNDPRIPALVARVLDGLEWRGPMEIELVLPAGGTDFWVSDVRCRLPAWSLLTHWAGCNLPVVYLRELLGRNAGALRVPRAGKIFVRGVTESVIPVRAFQRLERHASFRPGEPSGRTPKRARAGLRVAVTGVSSFEVVNAGIGVARALRRAPEVAHVMGLSYGTFDSGAYEPGLLDAVFRLPVGASGTQLFRRLRAIHADHPFDVIIPCLDGELENFIGIEERLKALGVRVLLPSPAAFARRGKLQLFGGQVAPQWGAFELPQSIIATSAEQVARAVAALGCPVAVKGPLAQCVRAGDVEQALEAWHALTAYGTRKVIVQPFIRGTAFAVSVVADRAHRCVCALTVKKLSICERGSTWRAVRVENSALESSLARLLAEIGWVGPAEGEFIRDALSDRHYLIEINPRFTAWVHYTALLGPNHPRLAACLAAGKSVEPAPVSEPERLFLRATTEIPIPATALAALSNKGHVRRVEA